MKKSVKYGGLPWLSDELVQLAGRELKKIAQKNKINNVRHLRAADVFAIIEADPNHPLRALYDWDLQKAARSHWIDQTRKIIAGLRYVTVSLPDRGQIDPVFYSAEAPVKAEGKEATERTYVLRSDVLEQDPIFMSALGSKLRRLSDVLREIEHLAAARSVPDEVDTLLGELREAWDNYAKKIAS